MSKTKDFSIPYKIASKFGYNAVSYNSNTNQYFYICPMCIERKGTPDKSGHLNVSGDSYLFNCYRCGYKGKIFNTKDVDDSTFYEEEVEVEPSYLMKQLTNLLSTSNNDITTKLKIPIDKVTTNNNATKYLLDRGFSYEQMEYYDMRVGNRNLEFGRIIIPNEVDHLVYTDFYSARTFLNQTPKYHNPSNIKKSSILFNYHRIKEDDIIILVEGALTAVAAGYHAVASLGKSLSKEQASLIAKKHPKAVYVNYDYGAEKELIEACNLLSKVCPETKIYQTFMKDDRDAADLSHEEYSQCLKNSILYNPLLQSLENICN